MKTKIGIVMLSLFLVMGMAFLIFNFSGGFTGYVIAEENVSEEIVVEVTMEDALDAIDEAVGVIQVMQEKGFSVVYVNDTLIEARNVFEQAEYAEILRGDVEATEVKKQLAKKALRLVNWREIDYSNVLEFTDEIKARRDKAFLISDKIFIREKEIDESMVEANAVFEQAKKSFADERYEEADELLESVKENIESNRAELATLSGLRSGAKNFFQRYWIFILLLLIILGVGGFFYYKKIEVKIIKNRINKMQKEREVLLDLMKKAQTERFKENSLSGLVYKIRMRKYGERLNEIKQGLPVLEGRLKMIIRKKE